MSRFCSSPHILLSLPASIMAVGTAILSKNTVTVFSRAEKCKDTSLCFKDWITFAMSALPTDLYSRRMCGWSHTDNERRTAS